MTKTTLEDDVKERIEYYERWLKSPHSNNDERSKVVDEATAIQFIRNVFKKDASLSHMVEGMDAKPWAYDTFVKSGFIQGLMKDNGGNGTALEIERYNKQMKMRVLQGKTPVRYAYLPRNLRKSLVGNVIDNQMLGKYQITRTKNKRNYYQYRDNTGKFIKNDKLLQIVDNAMIVNAEKRNKVFKIIEKYPVKE